MPGAAISPLPPHPPPPVTQLFSMGEDCGTVNGTAMGYNPKLYSQLQDIIPDLAAWFWGHEHTLQVWTRGRGVDRSICPAAMPGRGEMGVRRWQIWTRVGVSTDMPIRPTASPVHLIVWWTFHGILPFTSSLCGGSPTVGSWAPHHARVKAYAQNPACLSAHNPA